MSNSEPKKKPGILISEEWWQSFEAMGNSAAGELVKALISHAKGNDEPPKNKSVLPLWYPLKEQQECYRGRYENTCMQRSIAAWKKNHPEDKELSGADILQKIQLKASGIKVGAELCGDVQLHNFAVRSDTIATKSKSKSKSKVSKDTYMGFSENGNPDEKSKDRKKITAAWLFRCIGRLFSRRKSTTWSSAEIRKINELAGRDEILRECREICRFYRSGYEYRRRDIITLLNQWNTELDRSRNKGQDHLPASRAPVVSRQLASAQSAPQFDAGQRGKRCLAVETNEERQR